MSAKFVPHLLSQEQKDFRLSISLLLPDRANSCSGFLRSLITGGESWVYGYDPEKKMQSSHSKTPKSPWAKKRVNRNQMLIVFFDTERIGRAAFVPRGTTVNSEYYKGLLERLRKDVRRKLPEKRKNEFVLQHDNAPCHTSPVMRQFLAHTKVTVCPHSPYSPDLTSCDFWLLPKIKLTMRGNRFDTIPETEADGRWFPELVHKLAGPLEQVYR
jgi:hypothetical protein